MVSQESVKGKHELLDHFFPNVPLSTASEIKLLSENVVNGLCSHCTSLWAHVMSYTDKKFTPCKNMRVPCNA